MRQRVRVTALVKNGENVLLLHRVKEHENLDIWEFPSGTVEFGETPEQAVEREVREETGLNVKNKGLFAAGACTYRLRGEDCHEIVIAYLFEALDTNVKLDRREHTEFKWIKIKELFAIENLALTVKAILPEIAKRFGHSHRG